MSLDVVKGVAKFATMVVTAVGSSNIVDSIVKVSTKEEHFNRLVKICIDITGGIIGAIIGETTANYINEKIDKIGISADEKKTDAEGEVTEEESSQQSEEE